MMSRLLINNMFDDFLLSNLKLTTMVDFEIDGKCNKEWDDFEGEYISWSRIKPIVYGLIKGSKTPSKMKIIMLTEEANDDEGVISKDKKVINIKYDNDELTITTAISMATFSLDNTKAKEWDNVVEKLLSDNEIEYET